MLAVVSKIALSHSPLHKRAVASVPTYKKKLKIFVACGLGLEGELERELKELRILPNKCMLLVLQYSKVGIRQDGGLELKGELKDVYAANLLSHLASRVLLRLGEFKATSFPKFEEELASISWRDYLPAGASIGVRVTSKASKLFHTGAISDRVKKIIGTSLTEPPKLFSLEEIEKMEKPSLVTVVVVRLSDNICTISLDSSGGHLHKRGYRVAVTKAPLRETLAAAMIKASGWDARSPLIDPFVGSGTIPIEAALMASGKPPGIQRSFSFMNWSNFNSGLWKGILKQRSGTSSSVVPTIYGSDRDVGAIEIANANASRAGISNMITFCHHALSDLKDLKDTEGWMISNLPYGVRTSANDTRNLYSQIGKVLRRFPGWHLLFMLQREEAKRFLSSCGINFVNVETDLVVDNGGIKVVLLKATIPTKSNQKEKRS